MLIRCGFGQVPVSKGRRLELKENKIIQEHIIFDDLSRIRDIAFLPNGSILLATDGSGGEIISVQPN